MEIVWSCGVVGGECGNYFQIDTNGTYSGAEPVQLRQCSIDLITKPSMTADITHIKKGESFVGIAYLLSIDVFEESAASCVDSNILGSHAPTKVHVHDASQGRARFWDEDCAMNYIDEFERRTRRHGLASSILYLF